MIQPVDRKTPTAGNEIGFIDQILGNMSRYRHRQGEGDSGGDGGGGSPSPY